MYRKVAFQKDSRSLFSKQQIMKWPILKHFHLHWTVSLKIIYTFYGFLCSQKTQG